MSGAGADEANAAVAEAASLIAADSSADPQLQQVLLRDDAPAVQDEEDDDEAVRPTIEVDPSSVGAAGARRNSDVGERDVVLNNREDNHKMYMFLEDLVQLHFVLWGLQGKTPTEADLDRTADHIVKLVKIGKKYELAGLRDVPRPCLKSPGRILERDGTGAIQVVTDASAASTIRKMLVEKVTKDSLIGLLHESPYKEFKQRLERNAESKTDASSPLQVETNDVIMVSCQDEETEAQQQAELRGTSNMVPQQLVFNLAAQIVTMYTISAETQVKAALAVLNGLDEAQFVPAPTADDMSPKPATTRPRLLLRSSSPAEGGVATDTWSLISDEDVVEWAVAFVFEVHLEKDLEYLHSTLPEDHMSPSLEGVSKVPVKEPGAYDVLFGRGGMTNSHQGNRRFRDVIALHRPDYIRAIKMDKPTVARKIVKAIRYGSPPGRFLKKSDDGNWYDVGDRTAAEKTSQGLRERTNAEKRQRSQLRRALGLRKQDLEVAEKEGENATPEAKKAKVAGDSVVNLAASLAPTLNYVGPNLPVPLSLSMGHQPAAQSRKKPEPKTKLNPLGLNTTGLPPNAVDEEGNILVTDYDILLGRGGLTNHHKGNKRFRDIVALHRPDYVRAPKIQKPSVARVIVRAIRNGDPPGRFLKKQEKTGKWIDVGDKKAAEKTSQALREKAVEEREKLEAEASSGSPGILVPAPAGLLAETTANVMGTILASGTFAGSADIASGGEAKNDTTSEGNAPETAAAIKEETTGTMKAEEPVVEEVEV